MPHLGRIAVLALALSGCSGTGRDSYMRKHTPELQASERGPQVERGVSTEAARRITAHFPPGQSSELARVYSVPGHPERHLAVVQNRADTADYGLRFILLATAADSVTEIARSRGMADSDWLEPVFFEDGECQFLLADTGSETSWGVETFRLCRDSLTALGMIGVSAAAADTTTGLAENPLPFTRMRRDSGVPVVEFTGNLVAWEDTDGDNGIEQIMLPRKDRPLVYRLRQGGFVIDPDSGRTR